MSQFLLDGKLQKIKYKCLPHVCLNYDKYEHNSEKCPDRIIIDEKTNRLEAVTRENRIEKMVIKDADGNADHILKFSPWLLVTRKGKNQLQKKKRLCGIQCMVRGIILVRNLVLEFWLPLMME